MFEVLKNEIDPHWKWCNVESVLFQLRRSELFPKLAFWRLCRFFHQMHWYPSWFLFRECSPAKHQHRQGASFGKDTCARNRKLTPYKTRQCSYKSNFLPSMFIYRIKVDLSTMFHEILINVFTKMKALCKFKTTPWLLGHFEYQWCLRGCGLFTRKWTWS